MELYSKAELVKFGEYLLSKERARRIRYTNVETYKDRKRSVWDADIANAELQTLDINLAE